MLVVHSPKTKIHDVSERSLAPVARAYLKLSLISEAIMSGICDLGYLEEYILSVHYRSQRGAGAIPPPPPPMLFRSFVGTCKPTSMSFVPTKYLKYQQNIERSSSFRM